MLIERRSGDRNFYEKKEKKEKDPVSLIAQLVFVDQGRGTVWQRPGNQRTEEGEVRDTSRSVHAHQPLRVKRAAAPPAEQRYTDRGSLNAAHVLPGRHINLLITQTRLVSARRIQRETVAHEQHRKLTDR